MTASIPLGEILARTPPYVWAIAAVILAMGLLQMRTRNVRASSLFILPATMIAFSLYTAATAFVPRGPAVGFWFAGLGIAFGARAMLSGRSRATYDAANNTYRVPGSFVPLVVMIAIFAVNYTLGVLTAVAPMSLAEPSLRAAIAGALGFLSGLLVARAKGIAVTS